MTIFEEEEDYETSLKFHLFSKEHHKALTDSEMSIYQSSTASGENTSFLDIGHTFLTSMGPKAQLACFHRPYVASDVVSMMAVEINAIQVIGKCRWCAQPSVIANMCVLLQTFRHVTYLGLVSSANRTSTTPSCLFLTSLANDDHDCNRFLTDAAESSLRRRGYRFIHRHHAPDKRARDLVHPITWYLCRATDSALDPLRHLVMDSLANAMFGR
ncbi:hypothetical protein VTL71DRAFT_10000 [Oculimacula yallundae]|uniref:Uncharacterized protein n=1 Tax=Oculimacula yallundae TaxID=86028 RepID=A0ABR4BQ13_9HELO